jgi:hypothetical protein
MKSRSNSAPARLLLALAVACGTAPLAAQTTNPSDNPRPPGLQLASPPTGAALTPSPFEPAEHAFSRLDAMRRGFLTREQLGTLERFPFDEADLDGDGRLNAGEFANAWSRYNSRK